MRRCASPQHACGRAANRGAIKAEARAFRKIFRLSLLALDVRFQLRQAVLNLADSALIASAKSPHRSLASACGSGWAQELLKRGDALCAGRRALLIVECGFRAGIAVPVGGTSLQFPHEMLARRALCVELAQQRLGSFRHGALPEVVNQRLAGTPH